MVTDNKRDKWRTCRIQQKVENLENKTIKIVETGGESDEAENISLVNSYKAKRNISNKVENIHKQINGR